MSERAGRDAMQGVALENHKILITGPAGRLAFPLVSELVQAGSEVWGIARFTDQGARARVEALGVRTRVVDLATGDLRDLPRDFDYLLHFAAFIGPGKDYDYAIRANAEATGLLMSHCRYAKACLVVSTGAVYAPSADPLHLYRESDPLGDSEQPFAPTYGISKIAQESVARWAAREFDLPTTIARMNVAYSEYAGMPVRQLDGMLKGRPVILPPSRHALFNPIHQRDINAQVPRLLAVAGVPAKILNWAGDEAVEAEDWCRYMASLAGIEARFEYRDDALASVAADNTQRIDSIGHCALGWREGLRQVVQARCPGVIG